MSGRGKYDRTQTAQERYEIAHERLLDQATEVFAKLGYHATRVDDVIEAAQISRRTLYQHFPSVEAILEDVYARAARVSLDAVTAAIASVSAADPIARMERVVLAFFRVLAENPSGARVVFEQYRFAGAAQAARYAVDVSRYVALLVELGGAAHAAGRLARAPDELSAYALIKGLEGAGLRALERGELAGLTREVAPAMARLVVDAFGPRPA